MKAPKQQLQQALTEIERIYSEYVTKGSVNSLVLEELEEARTRIRQMALNAFLASKCQRKPKEKKAVAAKELN